MHQKNAMVLEDEDPAVSAAEAGGGTGNEAHDQASIRVKRAELEIPNVES